MDKQDRLHHAKLLNDNPFFKEIMQAIENTNINDAKNANVTDAKEMLAIITGFQVTEQIMAYIRGCITSERVDEYKREQRDKII